MIVLGIESSCDETAAAVVQDRKKILASVVSSQVDFHSKYGGVVPEIASRKHIEAIMPVVKEALENAALTFDGIEGIAVTKGPGLVGSLLIGISFAKALSYAKNLPLIGVNHLEGHLTSVFLEKADMAFPFIGLVVSGGHTNLYYVKALGDYTFLGQTRDDAAGEDVSLVLTYNGSLTEDKEKALKATITAQGITLKSLYKVITKEQTADEIRKELHNQLEKKPLMTKDQVSIS